MFRFDELSDIEFNDSKDLELFCQRIQDIARELFSEVYFASEILERNLSALTVEDSRYKAQKVARILRQMADNFSASNTLSIKLWRTFQLVYEEELEAIRGVKKKVPFTFRS